MKKLLSVLFVIAILVGCTVPYTTAAANTPTGTPINTIADFEAMTDGDYYLANDLDFSGKLYTNFVVASFSGTLDGNGKTIKNVEIVATEDGGIFRSLGATANTTIKNLVIEGVAMTLQSEAGLNNVGLLAGYQHTLNAENTLEETESPFTLTIENCTVSGTMNGMTRAAGGLLGVAKNATVKNTTTAGSFKILDGAGKYTRRLGGFFGETRVGVINIYNSSNSVDITIPTAPGYKAHMSVAGFVGVAGASEKETENVNIYNCVNFGNMDNGNTSRNHHQTAGFIALSIGKSTTANIISGCANFGSLIGGYWNSGVVGWNAYSKFEIKDTIIHGYQDYVGALEDTNSGLTEINAFVGKNDGTNTLAVSASCMDKRGVIPANKKAADHLMVVDIQSSAVASDKFSIRLVAGLTGMNTCKKIGFEVTTYAKSGDGFSVKGVENKECKYAFATLADDSATGISGTLNAADFGADALFALTIEGSPAMADNGLFIVVVRPYSIDGNGKTAYGEAVAVTYDAGAFIGFGTAN